MAVDDAVIPDGGGWVRTRREDGRWILSLGGRWETVGVAGVDAQLRTADPGDSDAAVIDLSAVETLDTAGAWLVYRTARWLRRRGVEVELRGAGPRHTALIDTVARHDAPCPAPPPPVNAFVSLVNRLGYSTVSVLGDCLDGLNFLGAVVVALVRTLVHPHRVRFVSLVRHMEQVGLDAIPIVGLISFLIGVVLAYQGADQLARFGAEIFTVNLVGVGVLREMGVLLTAIILAGRSGSAFTAQIGMMRLNEEVDAMHTIGLDPLEILVIPRILALLLTLPLLTFFADIMGLVGGAIMAMVVLDISLFQYARQVQAAVPINAFWVGIVKAPVFAFVIGLIGCYEGLRVSGGAESVGRLTTKAVVEAIFLVIVIDALFSVLFSILGF
ncbi:MAG: MlaE family lipid ABC transporter permease subunit [Alphaproteobacteria bacterium]